MPPAVIVTFLGCSEPACVVKLTAPPAANAPPIVAEATPEDNDIEAEADTPSGSSAIKSDVIASQPISAGADVIAVLVLKLSSDIKPPFVNTVAGVCPKSTTIVLELLDMSVPVTPVAVLAVAWAVLSTKVSPTVKLVSADTVKV